MKISWTGFKLQRAPVFVTDEQRKKQQQKKKKKKTQKKSLYLNMLYF